MEHEEAVAVLNSVLDYYPASYQHGEELSVIIQSNEQYTVGATVAIHPRSDQHRVVVLELAFRPMSFFKPSRATMKAIKKLTKKTSQESSITVTVGGDEHGSVQCLLSRMYLSAVDGERIDLDHAKMAALAMVAFGIIKDTQ